MSLLKVAQQLSSATFPIKFPVSKIDAFFRPYTVGDEKILLTAAAERDSNPKLYIANTLKVIRGCIDDKQNLILDKLVAADVEYLLMQIRAKSVGEKIDIKYSPQSKNDEKMLAVDIQIDLEKFYVLEDPQHNYTIELSPTIGMKMRDLTFVEKINYGANNKKTKTDTLFEMITDCVESIYDGDQIYIVGQNATKLEVSGFIETLQHTSKELYQFVATMPQLAVDIQLPNSTEIITLKGAEIDFLALSPAT